LNRSIIVIVALIFLMAGCKHKHSGEHQHHAQKEHHEEKHEHEESGHHHNANEYMHQSSIEELIERFESPERDAYQQPNKVLGYLGDLSGMKIMDLGAGSGYFSFRLVDAGAQVIAADVEEGFLKYMQGIKDSMELDDKTLELRKIPYDHSHLEHGEVDMVLVVNTYHHIEDRAEYFKTVLDGLKSDGELVIIDFFEREMPVGPPPAHKIPEEKVIEELTEAGFSQFDVNVSLLEYQFILQARK